MKVLPNSTMILRSTAIGWLAGLALTGCGAGWHRVALDPDPQLPPRQQVQIWQAGKVLRWHAVSVTADSVSGIGFRNSPECDTCRVTLPRESIDSLRIGNPTAGFWKSAGISVGVIFTTMIAICATYGCSTAD